MERLIGTRVFLVEDETLVLFNLEDILSELGCEVVAQAARYDNAAELARDVDPIDLAILDVNIGGEPVFPIAKTLAERGVPVIFSTGYGRDGLPVEWQSQAVLMKPYTVKEVEQALLSVLSGKGSSFDTFTIASEDQ